MDIERAYIQGFKDGISRSGGDIPWPTFTRKHYREIAGVFKYLSMYRKDASVEDVAGVMADMFSRDNPRFIRGLFLRLSGVHQNEPWGGGWDDSMGIDYPTDY